MKIRYLLGFLVFLPGYLLSCSIELIPKAPGRLGDRLTTMFGTLWIAKQFDCKVCLTSDYIPKTLTDILRFSIIPKQSDLYYPELSLFEDLKVLKHQCNCRQVKRYKVAFGIGLKTFYTLSSHLKRTPEFNKCFNLDKIPYFMFVKDIKNFFNILETKYMVRKPPKNMLSIALHYRVGSKTRYLNPIFTSIEHHFKGLDQIMQIIPKNIPVFIGVFSDSKSTRFLSRIRNHIQQYPQNISLQYMTNLRSPQVVDMLSMFHFDFITRGSSKFSFFPYRFGDVIGQYAYLKTSLKKRLQFSPEKLSNRLFEIRQLRHEW